MGGLCRHQQGEPGLEEVVVESGVEDGSSEAEGGHLVAMGPGEPLDEAPLAEASELVGQASLGQCRRREIEEVCQTGPEVGGREGAGVEAEVHEGPEKGLGSGLPEA